MVAYGHPLRLMTDKMTHVTNIGGLPGARNLPTSASLPTRHPPPTPFLNTRLAKVNLSHFLLPVSTQHVHVRANPFRQRRHCRHPQSPPRERRARWGLQGGGVGLVDVGASAQSTFVGVLIFVFLLFETLDEQINKIVFLLQPPFSVTYDIICNILLGCFVNSYANSIMVTRGLRWWREGFSCNGYFYWL